MTKVISPAVQDVVVESFRDYLAFGSPDYPNGTSQMFRREAATTLTAAQRAYDSGAITHSHLLLCAMYDALQQEDLTELRKKLVGVGSLVIDWIEQLDNRS